MVYRVIGLMSGSSLDGLDIVFAELEENRGMWSYAIRAADCYAYSHEWKDRLTGTKNLNAFDYLVLHTAYGKFLGECVNRFIDENNLHHQIQLIASHGHTIFHAPQLHMTAQLGDGAAIAAVTGINVVDDLRAMDVAFGGQGAPIVPMGEKLFFPEFNFYLNLGGIANLSYNDQKRFVAFDVCPANRVLNMLTLNVGKEFDEGGKMAKSGIIEIDLLHKLNELDYYTLPYPKSLSNDFGTGTIYPLVKSFHFNTADELRTYTEHIIFQVERSIRELLEELNLKPQTSNLKLLATGGGAFNDFLVQRLKEVLEPLGVEIIIPEPQVIKYKEALIMALLGVLRWREENTVMASVTGALRNTIGGAVWIGQEA